MACFSQTIKRRRCLNHADNFCYICGKYTITTQRKNITPKVKLAYHLYFGCKVGDQDKEWAPHICCVSCTSGLTQWLNNKRSSMPFAVPMVWREQKDHSSDCYFCMTDIKGYTGKNKKLILYPDVPSAIKPVPHDEFLPIPNPPADPDSLQQSSDDAKTDSSSSLHKF